MYLKELKVLKHISRICKKSFYVSLYNDWYSHHYDDVRMGATASQITSFTIVFSIVYSDADQRKHQSSASLAFVRGIHRGPVNFPHKWLVTRKMFPFDDVIMWYRKANMTLSMPIMMLPYCTKSFGTIVNGNRLKYLRSRAGKQVK